MIQSVLTKAFLQQPKAAAMFIAPRAETQPPPPTPPFLLAQNLSLKWIVPTDNMQPVRRCHMASSVVKRFKGVVCSKKIHQNKKPTFSNYSISVNCVTSNIFKAALTVECLPSTSHPSDIIHIMSSRVFPIFHCSSTLMYYTNKRPTATKMG